MYGILEKQMTGHFISKAYITCNSIQFHVIFVCSFWKSNCQTCLEEVLLGICLHIHFEHSGVTPHFSHTVKMYLSHCFLDQGCVVMAHSFDHPDLQI